MAVTLDIVAAYRRPRKVMARLLARGQREDRVLAMLMGACFVMFAAQWPWRAREAHLTGQDLTDLLQNDMFGLIFVFPLIAYGIAALSHIVAKLLSHLVAKLMRGRVVAKLMRGRGSWYGARLAFFWALLATTPLAVLAGLTKGLIGLGPANTAVGALWFAAFLWIWIASLWEAESQ